MQTRLHFSWSQIVGCFSLLLATMFAAPLAMGSLMICLLLLQNDGSSLHNRLSYAVLGIYVMSPYLIVSVVLALGGYILITQGTRKSSPSVPPADKTSLEYDY